MAGMDPPDSRFTQANERTFLAWNRTALAYIAGGLAVEQFLDAGRAARLIVAVPLILLGGFLGVAGYVRWQHAEHAIRSGQELDPSRVPATARGVVRAADARSTRARRRFQPLAQQ